MSDDHNASQWSRYVLYVAQSHEDPDRLCAGSRQAMKLMQPVKEDVLVQSVDVLLEKGVHIPEWLEGTPTLVDTTEKAAYKGSEALSHLKELTSGGGAPESLNEMVGVAPDGSLDVAFDMGQGVEMQAMQPADIPTGKVTEEDVERYMQLRNQNAPPPPPV